MLLTNACWNIKNTIILNKKTNLFSSLLWSKNIIIKLNILFVIGRRIKHNLRRVCRLYYFSKRNIMNQAIIKISKKLSKNTSSINKDMLKNTTLHHIPYSYKLTNRNKVFSNLQNPQNTYYTKKYNAVSLAFMSSTNNFEILNNFK